MAKKPVILVPLPSAAEDHQTKNALVLVEKNRISLFNNIHRAYTNLMNEKNNIVEIKVTTARNLSETEYAEVTEKVGKI